MVSYRRQNIFRRKRQQRLTKLIIALFVVGIGIKIIISLFFSSTHQGQTLGIVSTPTATPIPKPQLPQSSDALVSVVQSELNGSHGTYGIVIKNLKTGESAYINALTSFNSGSLYKLWVMAATYQLIQQGKLSPTERLSKSYSELNTLFHIDPEAAEKTDGTLSETVQDALTQMIVISDNYSALLLTQRIGLSRVANFLKENNLAFSHVGTQGDLPITTAYDTSLFFEKLYRGQLANPTTTQSMIELLKDQRLNDKLPRLLPDNVRLNFAHKTGELDDYSHDAGIVYTDNGDYIIVVLTQSDDPDSANNRMANISKAVYGYFTTETQMTVSPAQ